MKSVRIFNKKFNEDGTFYFNFGNKKYDNSDFTPLETPYIVRCDIRPVLVVSAIKKISKNIIMGISFDTRGGEEFIAIKFNTKDII